MTTGNQLIDLRGPVTYGKFGPFNIGPAGQRNWVGSDSPAPPAPTYEVLVPSYVSDRVDSRGRPFVIPEYRRRVVTPTVERRRGENALTANIHTGCGQLFYDTLGYVYGFGNTSMVANSPANGIAAPATRSWSANDDIALLNRLRAKMMGSEFDPSIFLATSLQSLDMLAGAALKINRAFTLVRRGKIESAARVLLSGSSATRLHKHPNSEKKMSVTDIANAQLELSYGWMPLLSDSYHASFYIAHNTQIPIQRTFRVRYRRPYTQTSTVPSNVTFPKQKAYVFGQYVARMAEDFAFSTQYLVGLDDPLSMAWERLPWSFVADWFIPIQDYLMARQFARQVKGTFVKTTGYYCNLPNIAFSGGNFILGSDTFSYECRNFTRSILTTLSVPYPKPKDLSSVPSWARAQNALALLVTRHGSTGAS